MIRFGRERTTRVEFTQNDLDQPRVLAHLGAKLHGFRGWRDSGEIDSASLSLGDDLLRDHDNVTVAQFPAIHRGNDQGRYVVALAHHRHASERDKFERIHSDTNVITREAWQSR